jgi:rRNA maturation endonuclease Nob1
MESEAKALHEEDELVEMIESIFTRRGLDELQEVIGRVLISVTEKRALLSGNAPSAKNDTDVQALMRQINNTDTKKLVKAVDQVIGLASVAAERAAVWIQRRVRGRQARREMRKARKYKNRKLTAVVMVQRHWRQVLEYRRIPLVCSQCGKGCPKTSLFCSDCGGQLQERAKATGFSRSDMQNMIKHARQMSM